ncbi:ABC transporter substrate-binding protein [Paenibacillus sp. GCM10028914]|uniref:ABC transporter substrate-binding protein n=1 Tax=Paenibacillus sp. GCM10028914 TaxID=3273416 RepID=UPI003613246D
MKRKSIFLIITFMFMLTTILSGCSGGDSEAKEPEVVSEAQSEVTTEEVEGVQEEEEDWTSKAVTDFSDETIITIQHEWGSDLTSELMKPIEEKLKAEGKNITVEWIQGGADSVSLQELNASGVIPDIIYTSIGIAGLQELDMVEPIDDYMKIYEMDTSKIDQSVISLLRSYDDKGSMIGVPTFADTFTLFYNKEIFDLFGVNYPTDHMTWDETIELAKKLTGERNGVQYRGLELGYRNSTTNDTLAPLKELTSNFVDPETDEVILTKDPNITRYFEFMKKFYSIPGIYERDPEKQGSFYAGGTAAMLLSWPTFMEWGIPEEVRANTNAVLVPIWGGEDKFTPPTQAHMYILNKYSENKDAAFQWMMEEVSEDIQMYFSGKGFPTVLKSPEVIATFGSEKQEVYEGQNVQAYFPDIARVLEGRKSQYQRLAENLVTEKLSEFANSDMNIAEFLRKVEEELDIKIKEEKLKQEQAG